MFQHTAARRQLLDVLETIRTATVVSTHSRAEAAAPFNTPLSNAWLFQHTAARRQLRFTIRGMGQDQVGFNTQPRGGSCALAHFLVF